MAYDEIQPIGTLAHNYYAAGIVATLVNLHRDRKRFPEPFPTEAFLIQFGQAARPIAPPRPPTRKDWRELKAIGRAMAKMYNEELKPKERKRKRHG